MDWTIPAKGPIRLHRPAGREAWLKLRQSAVTASQAGALLGVHEYTTAYELWMIKSGRLPKISLEDDPVLTRGELLEDDAIELLRRQHPDWKILHNVIPGGIYLEDTENHLGATPDAFTLVEGVPGVVQIKTTDHATFRTKWMQGEGLIEPPLWIAVQAMLEAYLANAQAAYVAVLVVGRTLDLHLVGVPIIPGVIKQLQKAAKDFWLAVQEDRPPEPDFQRDGEVIAALLPHDRGTTIDLSGDNEFCHAVAERQRLKDEAQRLVSEIGRHEAEIKHKMGTHAFAQIPGWFISHRTQSRKAYAVAATEFRKLTIREAK